MLFNTCRILPIIAILSSNHVRSKCKRGSPYRLVLFRNIKKKEYSLALFPLSTQIIYQIDLSNVERFIRVCLDATLQDTL